MEKSTYNVGDVVTGCVTGIERYGIFVNLDNYYSGLVHISEISNSFVKNINDYVNVGENIRVKVLDVDKQQCHLKLSIKNLEYKSSGKRKIKLLKQNMDFPL